MRAENKMSRAAAFEELRRASEAQGRRDYMDLQGSGRGCEYPHSHLLDKPLLEQPPGGSPQVRPPSRNCGVFPHLEGERPCELNWRLPDLMDVLRFFPENELAHCRGGFMWRMSRARRSLRRRRGPTCASGEPTSGPAFALRAIYSGHARSATFGKLCQYIFRGGQEV